MSYVSKDRVFNDLGVRKDHLPYNVIVVDDEPDAIKVLVHLLREYDSVFNIISKCLDIKSAKNSIRKNKPDLIFLDIRMPSSSGLELALDIKDMCPTAKIIFISAYHEHLKDGYKVQPFDFLTKPICPDELKSSLCRFVENYSITKKTKDLTNRLLVSTLRGQQIIPFEDIRYIEYRERKCVIYNNSRRESISLSSLNNLIIQLPSTIFIRINKYVVVNVNMIDIINKNRVELKPGIDQMSGESFIVGRSFMADLKKLLGM